MNKKSPIESLVLGCLIIIVGGYIAVNGGFISLHIPSVGTSTLQNLQLTSTTPTSTTPTSTTPTSITPTSTTPTSTTPTSTTPKIPQPTPVTNYSSQTNMAALYQYALQLVNADRQANGLNPIALSNIGSGQNHADDQLNIGYFSHWNSNGVKPYVTYTIFGGKGAMNENIFYTSSYCPTSNCIVNIPDPYVEIKKAENEFMNNDLVCCNNGHRDNILDPNHTHVNFGIAYNNNRFQFVEHFENDIVNWQTVQVINNELIMIGQMPRGYSIVNIGIFSDPNPMTLTEQELDHQSPYDILHYNGGTEVGEILPPLTGNYHYPECSVGKTTFTLSDGTTQCLDYTTFENNSVNPASINLSTDVSKWINSDGLHTVYLYLKDTNGKSMESTSLTLEYLK